VIIFFDEPYLGCFGSAYTPIQRGDVVRGLAELSEGIKSQNLLLGLHCCGNTDWSMLTEVPGLKIISFDAFSFLDRFILYAAQLKKFLERGGLLCWGIVPTQEYTGKETTQGLKVKIESSITTLIKKGLDKELVLERLLLSPSCGLGTLDTQKAEAILELLSQTSSEIREL
jgi:methionine synthase II (cobalamin-independent)